MLSAEDTFFELPRTLLEAEAEEVEGDEDTDLEDETEEGNEARVGLMRFFSECNVDEDTVVIDGEGEFAATRAAAAELADVYVELGCNGKGLSLAGEVVREF